MFGTLSITEDTEINYKNNFRNFPNAMMLLFRASTGEGKGFSYSSRYSHFIVIMDPRTSKSESQSVRSGLGPNKSLRTG